MSADKDILPYSAVKPERCRPADDFDPDAPPTGEPRPYWQRPVALGFAPFKRTS